MGQNRNEMPLQKPLQIWQAIFAGGSLVIVLVSIIVHLANTSAMQQERINYLVESKTATEEQFKEVNQHLIKITDKLTDIQISLQNKQDRK